MDLRSVLGAELERRRARNPRYSLRSFARLLGTHHSTLSQILDGRRRLTPRAIRAIGGRIGLTATDVDDACLSANAEQLLRLVDDRRFRADSRWIAMMLGLPLDDVNRVLQHLIFQRRLTMRTTRRWVRESV